jgi:hypothetical protein
LWRRPDEFGFAFAGLKEITVKMEALKLYVRPQLVKRDKLSLVSAALLITQVKPDV